MIQAADAGEMTAMERGCLIWVTGLPSSGKSTFAKLLNERLRGLGRPSCVLDGDHVRAALHPAPGYGPEARDAFYETLTGLAVLLAKQDLVVIVAATAGRKAYRDRARELAPRYLEIQIATELEECERRDSKGLYAKARAGLLKDVPGIGAPYERSPAADVVARSGRDARALDEAVLRLGALSSRPQANDTSISGTAMASPSGEFQRLPRSNVMVRLDQRLTEDHRRLEALFTSLLNAADGADQPTLQKIWAEFEAGLLAHLDAEEQYLLPHFEKQAPDAVREIRKEHEQIRRLITELGVRTDLHLLRKYAAEELIQTLREHAARETHSLYPWAEQSTNEQDKVIIVEALVREAQRRSEAAG